MSEVQTPMVKYIFLDVVKFTQDRHAEAMIHIIETLNDIVKKIFNKFNMDLDRAIFLPTGDGICIAIIEDVVYDLPLMLSTNILSDVNRHNLESSEDILKFTVRIGINRNHDTIVNDINNNKNVAGGGINQCQRIMNLADGNQILMGFPDYDILRIRKKYFSSFRKYMGTDKHNNKFDVYQYIDGATGVNVNTPSHFMPKSNSLSLFQVYYLTHALANKDFLMSRKGDNLFRYGSIICIYFRAIDSESISKSNSLEENTGLWAYQAPDAPFETQYDYYMSLDSSVLISFAELIRHAHLDTIHTNFERGRWGTLYMFPTHRAASVIEGDFHEICKELMGNSEIDPELL